MTRAETTELHTRILRVTLGVEESAIFWKLAGVDEAALALNPRAFEERWYGGRSQVRVKKLHEDFLDRYSFPGARAALQRWVKAGMPADAQRLCAHWHLQLVDPLYRRFSGEWLPARASAGHSQVDRDAVMPWINETLGLEYAAATRQMFAGKLLTAAAQAGLLSSGARRELIHPQVSLDALGYLLYLLRGVTFMGTFLDNPYLRSVGLAGDSLEERLRDGTRAGWWRYARMGHLIELDWTWPDLATWARETR